MEVARPRKVGRTSFKVLDFITVCRLYIRMKMWRATVEEYI